MIDFFDGWFFSKKCVWFVQLSPPITLKSNLTETQESRIVVKNELWVLLNSTCGKFSPDENLKLGKNILNVNIIFKLCPSH